MKMTIFWDVAPCSLVEVVSEVLAACITAMMMEAASTSEKSVNFYQTTRRNITEENHLNVKSNRNLAECIRSYCILKVVHLLY
jgi:hypothetical protein